MGDTKTRAGGMNVEGCGVNHAFMCLQICIGDQIAFDVNYKFAKTNWYNDFNWYKKQRNKLT